MSIGKVFIYINTALIAGITTRSFLYGKTEVTIDLAVLAFCAAIGLLAFRGKWREVLLVAASCLAGIVLASLSLYRMELAYNRVTVPQGQEWKGIILSISQPENGSLALDIQLSTGDRMRMYSYDRSVSAGYAIQFTCSEFSDGMFIPLYVSRGIVATCKNGTIHATEKHVVRTSVFRLMQTKLTRQIEQALPSPEAELLEGIMLGEQKALPEKLTEELRRTGTIHIAVLSGFNITVVAFVLLRLLLSLGIGIRKGIPISLFAVCLMILVTGVTAPAVRAGIMISVVLLAKFVGRGSRAFSALLFSASCMLVIDPLLLGWSLSFQLSFAATMGVMFADRLAPRFLFLPIHFGIQENARTTFAATVMTMPLLLFSFNGFSAIGLLANAIVLPFVPLAMALGVPVLTFGFIWDSISILVGYPAYVLLKFLTFAVSWLSHFSFAYAETEISLFGVAVWYAVAVGLLLWNRTTDKPAEVSHSRLAVFIGAGILMSLFVWTSVLSLRHQTFVEVIDVGQGDAIHIRTDEGFDVLIDGGPGSDILAHLGASMTFFDRTIELMILTHPHADHITGLLSVLKKYRVKEVWISGVEFDSPLYEEFIQLAPQTMQVRAGYKTSINNGAKDIQLEVLSANSDVSPDDLNDSSIVVRADIASTSFLFMGDAGIPVEERLLAEHGAIDVDIIKIGHQGSSDASSDAFIRQVHPVMGIISVGEKNSYGHPHEQTLETLGKYGVTVEQTKDCGTIRIEILGQDSYRVESRCTP